MSADGKIIIEAEIDASKVNTAELEKKLKSIGKSVSFSSVESELKRLAASINVNKENVKRLSTELKNADVGSKAFKSLSGQLDSQKAKLHENALAYNTLIKDLIEIGTISKDSLPKNFFATTGNVKNVTEDMQGLIDKGLIARDVYNNLGDILTKLENSSSVGEVESKGSRLSSGMTPADIQDYLDKYKSEKDLQQDLTASIKTRFAHEKQMRLEAAQAEKDYKGQITGTLGLLGMINPAFSRLSYAVRQFGRIGKFSFTDLHDSMAKFASKAKQVGNMNLVDGISRGFEKLHPTLSNITNNMLDLVSINKDVRADAWLNLKDKIQGASDSLLNFTEKAFNMDNIYNAVGKIGPAIKGGMSKGLQTCASGAKLLAKNLLSVKGLVASIAVGIVGMVASIKLVISATKQLFSIAKKAGTAFAKFYDFDKYFGNVDDMIKAYNDMESKEAALTALMKSRMAATDGQVQAMKDLIASEEESGVISKQLQVSAMQQLAAYTSETNSLETLLPVLNDYVAQMYGVDASEKQAESAAKLFGKAMKGQTETLRRSGYVTEAQAKAIKEAANETERAALLAKYMGERCKNMNDVLAQTNAGQQHKLANSMQEVQREFGQAASVLKTTFLPVATQVLAILARMASYAAALANSLAKFFGRSTKAAATTAGQIEDVTEATEGASNAAKKASNTMGIDELNVLNDDSDGGGGGAGNIVDPQSMNEDTSLIDGMTKSLDDMLAKLGSAYDLGLALGTKLTEMLQQIPWDEIKQKAYEAGQAIAEFLNGIIDSGLIEQAGITLGEGFNTIVEFLLGFVDNFDWASLGTSLANGLENLITTIDWGRLGKLLGDSLIGIFSTINNFLESFDWRTIGVAIADFLCGINWLELLGQVVEFAINALALLFIDLPMMIGTMLKELVDNIANSISDYITTNMNETGNNIIQALLSGITDAQKTIVEWVYNHVVVPIISAFGKYFGVDSDELHEIGTQAIEGFFNGIKEFISDPLGWLKENVVDPFINAIKALFDIHSPSRVMYEIGVYVIQGMLNGISSLVNNVVTIWNNLKTKTMNIVRTIIANVKTSFQSMKTAVSEIFDSMKSTVLDIFTSLKDGIKGIINGILGFIESLANGVIKGINTVIEALNSLQIDVPGWVTDLTGITSFGFNIPTLSEIEIPKLATGAVLPANNPFLAVVGDQKQGTNIEAPLTTIQDAVALVLQPYLERLIDLAEDIDSKDFATYIGDKEIAQASIRGQRQMGATLRTS